jgi:hypothetical protein
MGRAILIEMSSDVSEVTRRAIADFYVVSELPWAGRLGEDEFLARLYDLSKMESTDPRLGTTAGDIRQHRKSFHDWPNDWVFSDERFDLLHAPAGEFLRFLCETVHPVVRPDVDEARHWVANYNSELQADGWRLVETKQLSGKPLFGAARIGERVEVFPEQPTGWPKVDRQTQEVRMRLDSADAEESFQAIGLLCREVLISVAQEVYKPDAHVTTDGVAVSTTDAGRMLEAFFNAELNGGANEEARAHAKAALKLALALQHKRTADYRMAALCAEATYSVVNICALLTGRR